MGEVVTTIKLMPDSPDVDLEALKANIENGLPDDAELHKIDEEPIAFGLVALNVMVVVEDGEGASEATEEFLANLEGVSNIEVTDIRRLM